jgi:predicted DNA-binding mobile mystery protein A
VVTKRTARRALDRRTKDLHELPGLARPFGGWTRAVREALGMSTEQLGRRLGTTRQAVSLLERSELEETVRLASLRRAAEALDCTLVYAFVPNDSLDDAVRRQALSVARAELARVDQTMLLEAQRLDDADAEEMLAARVAELMDTPGLWRQ